MFRSNSGIKNEEGDNKMIDGGNFKNVRFWLNGIKIFLSLKDKEKVAVYLIKVFNLTTYKNFAVESVTEYIF